MRRISTELALLSVVLIAFAGCARSREMSTTEQFAPPVELAEAALKASLEAWRQGKPCGPVQVSQLAVEVSDSYRSPDRPLNAFEVIGAVGSGIPRMFAVKLDCGQAEPQVVRYVVIGHNPVWVFRQEDYERISHWEHKMDSDPESSVAP